MELPVIEASGTPYEIGYTHGSRAKEQIAVNIGVYKAMFMEYAGIGLCFNALSVDDTPHGVPLHIILRAILEQDDFTEAMEVVTQNEIGCPANIMIAGKYGEAIDLVPKYNQKDLAKCRFPDTFIRLGRAEYLAGKMTDISADDMKKIFTDHTDPGCSICHHPKTADDIGTVFNIIMNLNEGTFYVSFGRPCGNVYKKYYA